MSINFVQLCETVFSDLNLIEEADKYVLDDLSRKAYKAYLRKERAGTSEEANNQVQELLRLRARFIEEIKTPGLHTTPEQRARLNAMTDQEVENFIKIKAADETSESPRVRGTHFLTLGYLSQYTGSKK